MIKKYTLALTLDTHEKASTYWGYQLYSILLERLPFEYGEKLHLQGLSPISQNIVPTAGGNEAIWQISLFGNESIKIFSEVIDDLMVFHMENHKINFNVIKKDYIYIPDEKQVILDAENVIEEGKSFVMSFKTPTTFKSDNEYVLFPTISLVLKSLINKWDTFFPNYLLSDGDVIEGLLRGLKITGYKLQSNYFHFKSNKIPAFVGEITVSCRLPAPIMEILKLLLYFGQFSGVGIKTALGMGAIQVAGKGTKGVV